MSSIDDEVSIPIPTRFVGTFWNLSRSNSFFQIMLAAFGLSAVMWMMNSGGSGSTVPGQPAAQQQAAPSMIPGTQAPAAMTPGTQTATAPSLIPGTQPAVPASPVAQPMTPGVQQMATPAPQIAFPNGQMLPMNATGGAAMPQSVGAVGGGLPPAPISPSLPGAASMPVQTSQPPVAIKTTESKVDLSKMQVEEVQAPHAVETTRFGQWNEPKLRK